MPPEAGDAGVACGERGPLCVSRVWDFFIGDNADLFQGQENEEAPGHPRSDDTPSMKPPHAKRLITKTSICSYLAL